MSSIGKLDEICRLFLGGILTMGNDKAFVGVSRRSIIRMGYSLDTRLSKPASSGKTHSRKSLHRLIITTSLDTIDTLPGRLRPSTAFRTRALPCWGNLKRPVLYLCRSIYHHEKPTDGDRTSSVPHRIPWCLLALLKDGLSIARCVRHVLLSFPCCLRPCSPFRPER